jgi:hypothetical protein
VLASHLCAAGHNFVSLRVSSQAAPFSDNLSHQRKGKENKGMPLPGTNKEILARIKLNNAGMAVALTGTKL